MIIAKITVGVMFIMSAALLSGKGSWLIAGYNTASKEEKKQYNEKKLCRAMGFMLLLVTIATGILLIAPSGTMGGLYGIFVIVSIVITAIYANTRCKKK